MSAPALAGRGRRCGSGARLPGPAADAARPAPPPRRGDHLAAGARAGRVRLPALDRPDPRLARRRGILEVGDRVPAPARAHVAGERAADGERRRVRPARARDRARRLVEHERLVDLRRRRPRSPCCRSTWSAFAAATSSTRRTSASFSASCCSARSAPIRSRLVGAASPALVARPRADRRAAVPRSSGDCTWSGSRSGSGSRSPPGSACSPRAATR